MGNSDLATIVVLASAVLHASWNAVVRGATSPLLSLALVDATALLLCLAALPFVPMPSAAVLQYMGISVLLNTGYRLFLVRAYERGDFGKVYPIVRGTPPILVAATSLVFVGEPLAMATVLGVMLISFGVLILVGSDIFSRQRIRSALLAAAAGAFIAAYTLVDAIGVRLGGDALQYIVYLTVLQSIPIPLIAMAKEGRAARDYALRHWLPGTLGGFGYVLSYGLVIFAFTLDSVAKVSALRETSILAAAVIAAVFFGEPFGPRRVLSSVIIVAGIVMLKTMA